MRQSVANKPFSVTSNLPLISYMHRWNRGAGEELALRSSLNYLRPIAELNSTPKTLHSVFRAAFVYFITIGELDAFFFWLTSTLFTFIWKTKYVFNLIIFIIDEDILLENTCVTFKIYLFANHGKRVRMHTWRGSS